MSGTGPTCEPIDNHLTEQIALVQDRLAAYPDVHDRAETSQLLSRRLQRIEHELGLAPDRPPPHVDPPTIDHSLDLGM